MMEKARPRKRAWILGAGFSRSLGGPLMNDLLSIAAWRQVLALYHADVSKEDADLIFWLYHYGAKFPEGPLDTYITCHGERRWNDAEQFLEILDRAVAGDQWAVTAVAETYEGLRMRALSDVGATGRPNYRRETYPGAFARDTRPRDEDLAKMAKRMVAASCCAFLQGTKAESIRNGKERWIPYQAWFEQLTADDTIITFNYDLVVEMLQRQVGQSIMKVHVAGSWDDDAAALKQLPILYKLHGSVNWVLDEKKNVTHPDWTPALLGNDKNLVIATPGDSKATLAGELLGRLWHQACLKLYEAEEIYIIGFRFPQSDAYPRSRLLDAMTTNDASIRAVHVVLGPDRSADQARVLALLQWTLGAKAEHETYESLAERPIHVKLYAHAAYAEDFLDSWARANHP